MDGIMVTIIQGELLNFLFVSMTFCLYGYNFPLKVLDVLHVFLSPPHMDLSQLCLKTLFLQFGVFVVLFTGCLNLVWRR